MNVHKYLRYTCIYKVYKVYIYIYIREAFKALHTVCIGMQSYLMYM